MVYCVFSSSNVYLPLLIFVSFIFILSLFLYLSRSQCFYPFSNNSLNHLYTILVSLSLFQCFYPSPNISRSLPMYLLFISKLSLFLSLSQCFSPSLCFSLIHLLTVLVILILSIRIIFLSKISFLSLSKKPSLIRTLVKKNLENYEKCCGISEI